MDRHQVVTAETLCSAGQLNRPSYPHPIIAREGWPFLAAAFLIAAVIHVTAGWLVASPFWVITLFVLQFFRDPPRLIPEGDDLVLAPADGRVIKVEAVRDTYADRDALKVSIFMNVFNVHSNRSPMDATVSDVRYFPGQFFNADLDKASEANERNALILERSDGRQITCVQVAGLIARRILCYVNVKDQIARGSRFGFIRFGSRVDLYLPTDAEPRVSVGEKVSASSSVIARLPKAGQP